MPENNYQVIQNRYKFLIKNNIHIFLIKTTIITSACIVLLQFLIPDIPKIPETERNKLILLSFIQNPFVLAKLSDIEYKKGNKDSAIIYIEAAIGLLEMNGASEKTINEYKLKLFEIKS